MEIWIDTYQQKINDRVLIDPVTGCLIWQGSKTGHYGQIKVKLPSEGQSNPIYVHRLQYMLHVKSTSLPRQMEVSHLCHNTLCIAIEHLSLEPQTVNASRKRCRSLVPPQCIKHDQYPDCILFH